MSALAFINPAYLGALALGAIPILIHLMRKRRVRVVPWAAWEFLLNSTKRNRRRFRIEQIVLLITRISIVVLIVLAFCRPLLRSLSASSAGAGGRVHALIVLDDSLSMGHARGGVSNFERAKRVADDLVARTLRPGDSGALVLLSSKPTAAIGEPTFDLQKLRARIRGERVSDRGTDYAATAEMCTKMLESVKGAALEVYWITDSRRAGLPDRPDRLAAAWRSMAAAARVTWIDVAGKPDDNLSVGAPVFSRDLVTPGMPVRIDATVYNHSSRAAEGVLVHLTVDGKPAGTTGLDVRAQASAKASFLYPFERAGAHTGQIRLGSPDELDEDDKSSFAVQVRDRLTVLLLNGRPNTDPARDEAFYLSVALAPQAASAGGRTPIRVVERSGTSVAGISLSGVDVVAIAGLTGLAPSDRAAIEQFVRSGGGLALFPAADASPARLAELGSLLPCTVGRRRTADVGTAPTVNVASIAHPALAAFRDTGEVVLGTARFTVTYDLTPSTSKADEPGAMTMARFSDGRPAMVERALGLGKVIVVGTTAGAAGSDLPFKPAYVPLMHQIVSYLAAGPASQHIIRVDRPFTTRLAMEDAGKPVRLSRPDGRSMLLPTVLGAEGVVWTYRQTDRAGTYRLTVASGTRSDAFAVNSAEAESDLAWADEGQIRTALGGARTQFAKGADDVVAMVRQSRHGVETWRALVWSALALLLAESLLARRFGRRG